MSLSLEGVTFHPNYPKITDGVVLISADQVAFCVEDFYLKEYRSVAVRHSATAPTC